MCDRSMPTCRTCARLRRTCLGYGVRLCWPTTEEHRRSIVAAPVASPEGARPDHRPSGCDDFVNVTFLDMEMYYHVFNPSVQIFYPPPYLHRISEFSHTTTMELETELISYFCSVVSTTMVPFNDRKDRFSDLLLRLCFFDESSSSRAVLRALLALSWVHRNGYHYKNNQLKLQAIADMRSSMSEHLGQTKVMQHIAAGMLLCSFEIFVPSESSFQWPIYLAGVKMVIEAHLLNKVFPDQEISTLVCWTYYHDVLSLFSFLHWKKITPEAEHLRRYKNVPLRHLIHQPSSKIDIIFGCSLEMLDLLYAIFKFYELLGDSTTLSDDDIIRFQTLDAGVQSIQQEWDPELVTDDPASVENVAELYRLASIIYLHRRMEVLQGPSPLIEMTVDSAFAVVSKLSVCEHAFPLSIVACEARTDERRRQILTVMSRTEEQKRSRSYVCIRTFITAFWNQDDLDAKGDIPYSKRLDTLMTLSEFLPPLT
ncbi:fungal-specific transcription factor domain-containing protein [Xylogone sp. PMI_703]|nr:fungal-specific transcription factor domain-containing protein [Xylogone sp. PMI_703]